MTAKNPLKAGAYVRCPRRHELMHAWIGPAIASTTSSATALRMECAHQTDSREGWRDATYYDELGIGSPDIHPIVVMCACEGGTLWRVDPRRIPELLPTSGMVDVEVARVLWL